MWLKVFFELGPRPGKKLLIKPAIIWAEAAYGNSSISGNTRQTLCHRGILVDFLPVTFL
jgi:hypothetical protein